MDKEEEREKLIELVSMSCSRNEAGVAGFIAENIYNLEGRLMEAAINSIRLTPDYVQSHRRLLRILAGQASNLSELGKYRLSLLKQVLLDCETAR